LFGDKSDGKRTFSPSTPRRCRGGADRVSAIFKLGIREGLKNIRRRCVSKSEDEVSKYAAGVSQYSNTKNKTVKT
jgi:hypothetical protein